MLTRARSGPPPLCSASKQSTPLTLQRNPSTVARPSRRKITCGAQANSAEEQQEDVEYKDTWSDVQFINMCRTAYGNLAGWQSPRDWKDGSETYQGMLEVSRALMKVPLASSYGSKGDSTTSLTSANCCTSTVMSKSWLLILRKHTHCACMQGKSAAEQRDAVIRGFPQVPTWFRKVFPYSKWGAELNARITPAFFSWLVGPMETETAEVNGRQQRSSVHIKRCRYHKSILYQHPIHS